jgi:hypothetical protein
MFEQTPTQRQNLLGPAEAAMKVEQSKQTLFRHLKVWRQFENPIRHFARFIQMRVGNPMRQRPENFNRRFLSSLGQFTALIEKIQNLAVD